MPKALTHPKKDVLSAFGLGKLPPERSHEVEAHIAECEPCCETLLNLQSNTFIDLVRSSNADQANPANNHAQHNHAQHNQVQHNQVQHNQVQHNQVQHNQVQSHRQVSEAVVPPELINHSRYRAVELLGRGGMGDVYKAEHRLMNRLVAMKLINREWPVPRQA